MTASWKPPHQTAQQRAKRRSKLDAAQLAPSYVMPPVICRTCKHARLIHGPERCLRVGCECTEYLDEEAE